MSSQYVCERSIDMLLIGIVITLILRFTVDIGCPPQTACLGGNFGPVTPSMEAYTHPHVKTNCARESLRCGGLSPATTNHVLYSRFFYPPTNTQTPGCSSCSHSPAKFDGSDPLPHRWEELTRSRQLRQLVCVLRGLVSRNEQLHSLESEVPDIQIVRRSEGCHTLKFRYGRL